MLTPPPSTEQAQYCQPTARHSFAFLCPGKDRACRPSQQSATWENNNQTVSTFTTKCLLLGKGVGDRGWVRGGLGCHYCLSQQGSCGILKRHFCLSQPQLVSGGLWATQHPWDLLGSHHVVAGN